MISNKTVGLSLKIIKKNFNEVRLNLEMMEKADIGDGFVEYLREDSIAKLGIAKRHIDHVVGKLERGKGMKYKYVKHHANYDLTLNKEYDGFKYKEGWILIKSDDRGGSVLYRGECFEVVK